ncbi:hypothetical protein [Streptomyces radicis]|uniref:Uncharacterized protein n=1 Tax=Streptomyces radicis TaxID=1750517 RepID=A0A3A9WGW9_9ACTN|nr:hypothetical protein [Streptomyces radicis]RKN12195.1 hypothetical protein D7319_04795 [Streptomyces radicis]RKN25753.1 hypothetical protein D7318_05685 [Streptomyces radicis]
MRFAGSARPSVTGTLRALEGVLLGAGRRTALRNARAAVEEDRERAAARREAERALAAVAGRRPPGGPVRSLAP